MPDRKPIQHEGIGRGAPGVPRSSSLSRTQINFVIAMLDLRFTISEIARHLGVSRDQVRTVKRYREGQLSRPSRSQRCA